MPTTITITKRTARNTCFTIVAETGYNAGVPRKESMLHDKFVAWIAKCPEYIVTDNAK